MALNSVKRLAGLLKGAAAASLLVVGFAGTAAAQDAPAAEAAPPPAAEGGPLSSNPWVRLCGNEEGSDREICFIQSELRTESGQFLASAGIREVTGDNRRALIVQTPVGVLLQPGMRVQVDQGTQAEARYTICFQNACFAELAIEPDSDFIASLKRGNTLILTVLNQQANAVNFEISLSGFTAAYDGPPLDLAAREQQQQDLEQRTQDAAAAMQQRLIEAQRAAEGQAGGEEAPAPQ